MNCEMCGQEAKLFFTKVESANLSVCRECAAAGNAIKLPNIRKIVRRTEFEVSGEFVVTNFHNLIKQAREQKGWKQEEMAKKLALKESLVHKMENGSFTPSLDMARRIGKYFGISLVETYNEQES